MTNHREILRLATMGMNRTSIGAALGCSRNTVAETLARAKRKNISYPLPTDMSDIELETLLFPENAAKNQRRLPDCELLHKELGKPGVTLTLLWDEYCAQCRQDGDLPYAYTQFRHHYHRYVETTKATMHLTHKPGAQLEVDWAGQTAFVLDSDTGERVPAYIFVATLPCSMYAYAEAFLTREQESWISAHVHAFNYFGGVPRILVPDNLKTGVDKADWYSPKLNKSYQEMAEYYGCAVIPARVRKPKDKPSVEGSVGVISTWITAALRNNTFFNLTELNEAIAKKLSTFNEKTFQKKPGSRYSAFTEEEKEYLLPLPRNPYELAIWRKCVCGFNYHIAFEKNFYSVPHEYIKQELDVRVTSQTLEVFSENQRICSHARLYGRSGQYSTVTDHMPEKHKKYSEWNAERFVSWAKSIGVYTQTAIKAILAAHKVEQQGYRACMGVLKLSDKYGAERLESACRKALQYTPNPSYKNIDSILKSGQDRVEPPAEPVKSVDESYSFIRGAEYYGRKK